ncbi:hypothetical protein SAMN06265370_11361 [Puniceibacterium sediminis]|uniref:Uncharacterized protein n=1 Tax=Puniceibacterium sediminis TaxID=1608407 RepID=A0A238XW46_9RHOB|nr:hypothetical protein SAMN06265370_11361 [Puniceibacterium sediminis]
MPLVLLRQCRMIIYKARPKLLRAKQSLPRGAQVV